MIFLNDDFYLRYIIGKNLFDSVFQMFTENLFEDNMANSTILDFFKSLASHLTATEDNDISDSSSKSSRNFVLLNKYLCGRFNNILTKVDYVPFTAEMLNHYEDDFHNLSNNSITENTTDENDNTTLEVDVESDKKAVQKRPFNDVGNDE